MNWFALILVSVICLAIIIFLAWRNQKDEKKLEKQLNNDFPDATKKGADVDAEVILK